MATYVVGDVHGCFNGFLRLLEKIRFTPARDILWLVGDLVNRGPHSLEMLRWARQNEEHTIAVLGNHDLHLLMVHAGFAKRHGQDTMADILAAPDADELCDWLRHRPLAHLEKNHLLIHAGLLPQWTAAQAAALCNDAEEILRGKNWRDFFAVMYGNRPSRWSEDLPGFDRARFIINAATRMRAVDGGGNLLLGETGPPDSLPEGAMAWFDAPRKVEAGARVLCGHWSAAGLVLRAEVASLDTGCLWGGPLTALRLEDGAIFQSPADEGEKISGDFY